MILISHRGNIDGQNSNYENNPIYIDKALSNGYDVEIDVRYVNNRWYLGHDEPQYEVDINYLDNSRFWIHCKDINSLSILINMDNINTFWHNTDNYTITTHKYIWAYPGYDVPRGSKSICVLPELNNQNTDNFTGICSDYISKYKANI